MISRESVWYVGMYQLIFISGFNSSRQSGSQTDGTSLCPQPDGTSMGPQPDGKSLCP